MIEEKRMREVYEEMKTPYKLGMVLKEENALIDSPNVFQINDKLWGMVYAKYQSCKEGYETWFATSSDLIHWKEEQVLLNQRVETWDARQASGGLALLDPLWEGSHKVFQYEGKYWMSYLGGSLPGYETDPLSIGIACTDAIPSGIWTRLPKPVLTPGDENARPFEKATLYKSTIIEDKQEITGRRFVMFYNGKQKGVWVERIGMAVSNDMVHWTRYGEKPVIENENQREFNICGDPQLILYQDMWVMHYFVCENGTAFDTFACSEDMIHWTKWKGEPLIVPSEPYDMQYAHKPFLLKYNGRVYHFYCAVGQEGRGIAVAVSTQE